MTLSNRGFEFEFGFTDRYNDLALQFSLNGGFTKNRIEFWDESPGVSDYQKSTGHPMGSMLLYNAIGIFRDQAAVDKYPHWPGARPGDIIFEDVNNDGQINGLDQVRIFKNNIPTFTGGLSIGVTYKNFYMNALLQYATGAMQIHYVPSGDGWANYLEEDIDGRWTPDNIDAKKPRTWSRIDEYWMYAEYSTNNTFFIRNNDYIRLKNVEIGLNLPTKLINKIGVKGTRLYISGFNVITIDKLKSSDPEAQYFYTYPVSKVFNAGINITL